MNPETRKCQNCKANFTIEPGDFAFYEKMKVPPPTFCSQCRLQRRMIFRNERKLYKRPCDCHGKVVFSSIAPGAPAKIYTADMWYSDAWSPMDYGRDYDFSRPFFSQLKELIEEVPRLNRSVLRLIDSDYCNNAGDLKSCYLLFNSETSEGCAYGDGITDCKEVFDSYFMKQTEKSYESFACQHSYNVFFSSNLNDSHNIWFSHDLVDCSNCFGCVSIRHKSYMIFNEQYSREEYFKKIKDIYTGSHTEVLSILRQTEDIKLKIPVKYMHGRQNAYVSGDYISHSRNVLDSFFIDEFEDCRFCFSMGLKPTKDCYDFSWGGASELVYEAVSVGLNTSQLRFIYECWPDSFDLTYCGFCPGSSHLFACVGLRSKQYCILNKQYTKEEYEKLMAKIIEHMSVMPYMDHGGRIYSFGEFFPPELSPFAYNETIAQEYFPLTKDQAIAKGYAWRDPEPHTYEITRNTASLPNRIADVPDAIVNEVIECGSNFAGCATAFRIIPQELEFYRRMNLPLPRSCPNCRHYRRTRQRNPPRLWHRSCQCAGKASANGVYMNQTGHGHGDVPCSNEFQTSYAPERKEIVYCETCYQSEVV